MQPRKTSLSSPDINPYLTTIKFCIADLQQYQVNSPAITNAIEDLLPVFAQELSRKLGAMAKRYEFSPWMNGSKSIFGAEVQLEILTSVPLNNAIEQTLKENIALVCKEIFINMELVANKPIVVSSIENPNPDAKYKTLDKRTYSYNALNIINNMSLEFINEKNTPVIVSTATRKRSVQFDAWSNVVEIKYEHATYILPSQAELDNITNSANKYATGNHYTSFCKSISAGDFNQALRKACATGNFGLALLLISAKDKLNLRINETSSNGKTPLDYAIESNNQQLVMLLKVHDAKESDAKEIIFDLVGDERREIIQQNNMNRQNQNRFNPFDDIERVNRINRENQARNPWPSSVHSNPSPLQQFGMLNIRNQANRSFTHSHDDEFNEVERINRENLANNPWQSSYSPLQQFGMHHNTNMHKPNNPQDHNFGNPFNPNRKNF